jgi:23S rRNA (guanosine2251-2'-O)-methyltransferase
VSRRKDGHEYVCGQNSVSQTLVSSPDTVLGLWVSSKRNDARTEEVLTLAETAGIKPQIAEPQALDRMANGARHQGVVLKRRRLEGTGWAATLARLENSPPPLCLALDGVMDPHNLGACIRSAAGAGADTVIFPRSRGGSVTPTVTRVASGGAELVRLAEVPNLARALEQLRQVGFSVVGLAGEGSQSLFDADFSEPTVIVAGAEDGGLRRLTREVCSSLAHIPMAEGLESLNVSVAAAIALFEVRRVKLLKPLS